MAEPVIYIIDDDKANNFLTRLMLEDAGLSNFKQYRFAQEALDELQRICNENQPDEFPYVILLDINMPAMDGWSFLLEYRKLPTGFSSKAKIYLLSSSDYPGDYEKAKDYPEVIDFLEKPLTEEVAKWLKEKYFGPAFE
ncbi:MAG TPA: response regulator [Chitinophagales bacterium]|nr:response regulator [Chitinophagales bacterium]